MRMQCNVRCQHIAGHMRYASLQRHNGLFLTVLEFFSRLQKRFCLPTHLFNLDMMIITTLETTTLSCGKNFISGKERRCRRSIPIIFGLYRLWSTFSTKCCKLLSVTCCRDIYSITSHNTAQNLHSDSHVLSIVPQIPCLSIKDNNNNLQPATHWVSQHNYGDMRHDHSDPTKKKH